jgi:Mn-dependent DtxR family transcriptional regulator
MSKTESTEMYLETLYLLEKAHGHAHTVEIAEKLDVSKPSVSKAMNNLKQDGLVEKEAYGTIQLTEKGRNEAKKIYSKHKLLTQFFHLSLGISIAEAEKNACKMEHIVSKEMMVKVKEYVEKMKGFENAN